MEDTQMNCLVCGTPMHTQRENFRYTSSGLPNVTLCGVEVSRCPQCGEYEVAIPQLDNLHKAIAQALIRKSSRLTAAEIRYLRKYLGWSGANFASYMGATPETVSRWETGAEPMGAQADRLLRLMVVTRAPVTDYSLDVLKKIAKKTSPTPVRLGLKRDNKGWHAEAA
jgi:putative zinc finger/helix-turn-helix YgiT family protein